MPIGVAILSFDQQRFVHFCQTSRLYSHVKTPDGKFAVMPSHVVSRNGVWSPLPLTCVPRRAPGKCGGNRLRAHPEGKRELKRLWAQNEKATCSVYIYMYRFRDEIKSQNRFLGCHEASNTQIWILFPLWLCLDTANHCRNVGRVGRICWHDWGDLYAFGHVVCNTPAMLVGVIPWCRSLMVVIFTSSCWICYCYIPVGGAVKWWIVGWLRAPWEIMLCSWVFRFAEPQRRDGLDDLLLSCWIPHSMISSFVVAPHGFNSKVHSKVCDWCWQIFCGWLVSLVLGNDRGIPPLSLWTIWTSCVGGSYERLEYWRFSWVPLLWYLWIYPNGWCSHESWRKRGESVILQL